MIWADRPRIWLQAFLGIDKMQKEIDDLRQENEKLTALFDDHDKAIAYISIVHARAFKDIMEYFKNISSPQKQYAVSQKKPDDDLIN